MTKCVVLPVEPTEEIRDAINTHLNEYGHHEDCTMLWEAIKEAVSQPDVVVVERGELYSLLEAEGSKAEHAAYANVDDMTPNERRIAELWEESIQHIAKQLLEGAG